MSQQQQHHQAVVALDRYLESVSVPNEWPRVNCCDVSQFLYCCECCSLLIPKDEWPDSLLHGTFQLPFSSLHVILRDRKTCATGLQAIALLKAAAQSRQSQPDKFNNNNEKIEQGDGFQQHVPSGAQGPSYNTTTATNVSLFDVEAGDSLPDYDKLIAQSDGSIFLLYPDETSVPISSVTNDISTLVVLDFTWQRKRPIRSSFLPSLACLPRVHLTAPPEESRFWRWHNAGPGMVSTIEALFYASWEIALQKEWSPQQLDTLLDLMWLFGLQRYQITTKYCSDRVKPLPFTEDGKEFRRATFRTIGTDKHQRDIERGKIMKKKHREQQKKAATINGNQQDSTTTCLKGDSEE